MFDCFYGSRRGPVSHLPSESVFDYQNDNRASNIDFSSNVYSCKLLVGERNFHKVWKLSIKDFEITIRVRNHVLNFKNVALEI